MHEAIALGRKALASWAKMCFGVESVLYRFHLRNEE